MRRRAAATSQQHVAFDERSYLSGKCLASSMTPATQTGSDGYDDQPDDVGVKRHVEGDEGHGQGTPRQQPQRSLARGGPQRVLPLNQEGRRRRP